MPEMFVASWCSHAVIFFFLFRKSNPVSDAGFGFNLQKYSLLVRFCHAWAKMFGICIIFVPLK